MGAAQTIVREKHGRHVRLVSYAGGSAEIWDSEWSRYSPEAVLVVKQYYRHFSIVHRTLLRYLPREGEVLEAGSGLGHWVALLTEAGLRARGMDFSKEAIVRARQTFPHLRFDPGDVRRLPYDDESMSGYVSFGVAEHFREGPDAVLREAFRVLAPGGILILTVPRVSPLRRIQPVDAPPPPGEGDFYQYFFEREEFEELVERFGFQTLAHTYYGTMKALRDVIRVVKRKWLPGAPSTRPSSSTPNRAARQVGSVPAISHGRRLFWTAQNLVFENPLCRGLAGHMLLIVARRP